AAQKIDVVAVVVDAVEEEVVLRGTRAVGREPACGVESPAFRLGMRDARGEASKEVVVAAAQREIVDLFGIDRFADGPVLSLEHGSGRLDGDGLGSLSGREGEVDHHLLLDTDLNACLASGLKSFLLDI